MLNRSCRRRKLLSGRQCDVDCIIASTSTHMLNTGLGKIKWFALVSRITLFLSLSAVSTLTLGLQSRQILTLVSRDSLFCPLRETACFQSPFDATGNICLRPFVSYLQSSPINSRPKKIRLS